MLGGYKNFTVAVPSSEIKFASYDSVCEVYRFREAGSLLNVHCLAPHYWRSAELGSQYVSTWMLVVRVPVWAVKCP